MKIRTFLIIAALLAFLAITYFTMTTGTRNRPPAVANKLRVVTSFYPLYYFATQIAGDKAIVYNITPAGAEPHDYEPTTQDMAHIEDSKLLILNGGKLEAWGDKVKNTLQNTATIIVSVGDDIANQKVIEDGETVRDPHVWLDPVLAKKEATTIADSLAAVDPANANFYENNATQLLAKLDALDQKYRQDLSSCKQKNIATAHTAFGYLAREYEFEQIAISGLSPDAEPSAKKLADVTDYVKKHNIKYIFFESLVSPKLAETLAYETGAKTLVLNPLEGLTNQEIAQGQDYFTVMRNNLKNLQTALDCK
ncbi:MAG: zinc ABC transporter substrate-binding protein [Candidatus Magasanikbacteria bacterium]|nr:zinc ABC transporter substrate-binding protein [Candidatus Magasanikbacteria bacterium]